MRRRRGVACIVLAALAVMQCGGPDRGEVASRVYLVKVTHYLSGIPVRGPHRTPIMTVTGWFGSATAVSWDGDLLTARHIADIGFLSPELCIGEYYDDEVGVLFKDAKLLEADIAIHDPNTGLEVWRGSAVPATDGGPVCDTGDRVRLVWHPGSTAIVMATDSLADVALLHITVSRDIPHFWLWADPQRGMPVAAFGRGLDGSLKVFRGTVSQGCALDLTSHLYRAALPQMSMSSRLWHGMSGGPVVNDDGLLVGINTGIIESVSSFAVPATYLQPWYDWVKGRRLEPPPLACPGP